MNLFITKVVVCLCLLASSSMFVVAQTQLIDDLQLVDRTTTKSIIVSKPSSLSSGQTINFPTAIGSANQVLSVSSVAGNTVNLGWVTPSSGSSTTSNLNASDETVATGATPTGLAVSASANKSYRVTGVLRGNRATGGDSDKLVVYLAGPTGSTRVSVALRCYNCPAGTTGVPAYTSAAAANVTTGLINPAGGTANANPFAYGIDGLVITGGSTGNVTVYFDDGGDGTANVTLKADSYILLTEIE